MRLSLRIRSLLVLGWFAGAAVLAAVGDASRGEEVLRNSGCTDCHVAGKAAPDFAKRLGRGYSPTSLAAVMWNHAPAAWARLEQQGTSKPNMNENQVAELFAYLCSRRFFESPGDAKRGKQFFTSGHCADCHGVSPALSTPASQAVSWPVLSDPIALSQQMWNQSVAMRQASSKNEVSLPQVSQQELTDLFVYLENLPQNRRKMPRFSLASAELGRVVFQDKGCAGCHTGKLALERRSSAFTMAGVAAALWNHGSRKVDNPQPLSYTETQNLMAYIWAARTCGNPDRGRRVFAKAHCDGCHGDSGIEGGGAKATLAKEGDVPTAVVSALWAHGPSMHAVMQKRSIAWPRLTGGEIVDLGAFLRTDPVQRTSGVSR